MSDFTIERRAAHAGGGRDKEGKKKYKVEFKQIHLSKPMVAECMMTSTPFPKEQAATYHSAPLYIDMAKSTITTTDQIDETTGKNIEIIETRYPRCSSARCPSPRRSTTAYHYRTRSSPSLQRSYDEGGYFIINGREGAHRAGR